MAGCPCAGEGGVGIETGGGGKGRAGEKNKMKKRISAFLNTCGLQGSTGAENIP